MTIHHAASADFAGQIVLVRADFNVPLDGVGTDTVSIRDDIRIRRTIPGLQQLLAKGARLVLMSHFGRPKGETVPEMSLAPIAKHLESLLGEAVSFLPNLLAAENVQKVRSDTNARVFLLENLRFHPGEEANDAGFAAVLARLADSYVNDAFSCSHRAHASIAAITDLLPAYAGATLSAELEALSMALEAPKRPVAAVVGGAKISTKLDVLTHLISRTDKLILGGGMANTFLAAQGVDMGASLMEADMISTAQDILEKAASQNCEILLPVDGVASKEFAANADTHIVQNGALEPNEMVLDLGPASIAAAEAALSDCKTLVWNGPMGAFEIPPFDMATNALAGAAAKLTASGQLVSIAGGGDTLAALKAAGVSDEMSYLSLAGGAFLEWLEGKTLPGIAALEHAR